MKPGIRTLVVRAQVALDKAELHSAEPESAPEVLDALDTLREAAFPAPEVPSDDQALLAALPSAVLAPDDEAALAILRDALSPFRALRTWSQEPAPDRVIWLDGRAGAILRRGEVGLLASAGGLGKSFLTLQLALQAADGGGSVCGFGVVGGSAAIIGYEDSAGEVARRALRLRTAAGSQLPLPDGLHLLDDPPALFAADPKAQGQAKPCGAWGAIFCSIRAMQPAPALVVIDPASAALADVSVSESGPVRRFLGALRREAAAGNFGVLVVAHDTKAARNEARDGGDPGAGAVAGSATWHDAARSVLHARRDPNGGTDRLVEVRKANYGPTGGGVCLHEVEVGNDWCGFELAAVLNRNEMQAATAKARNRRQGNGPVKVA